MGNKKINISFYHDLTVDETGTMFIEDINSTVPVHVYLPDLIKFLISVNNEHNPNKEDHFKNLNV